MKLLVRRVRLSAGLTCISPDRYQKIVTYMLLIMSMGLFVLGESFQRDNKMM
jgi:hypothetical protein